MCWQSLLSIWYGYNVLIWLWWFDMVMMIWFTCILIPYIIYQLLSTERTLNHRWIEPYIIYQLLSNEPTLNLRWIEPYIIYQLLSNGPTMSHRWIEPYIIYKLLSNEPTLNHRWIEHCNWKTNIIFTLLCTPKQRCSYNLFNCLFYVFHIIAYLRLPVDLQCQMNYVNKLFHMLKWQRYWNSSTLYIKQIL